jgi:hypothetical protein
MCVSRMCLLLIFNFNYSSIASIGQCNGPFNHFNRVACLARYNGCTSIGSPHGDRFERSGRQNHATRDRDRLSNPSIGWHFDWNGRLPSEGDFRVDRACDTHKELSRAYRASMYRAIVRIAQFRYHSPIHSRVRIDQRAKSDSIRPKTNPATRLWC